MSVTTPNIPEKSWENPFPDGTPLWELFDEILKQDRDLIIVLDDYLARRGTGKTIASLQLANAMDQTEEGVVSEKVSLSPEEIRNAYASQPPRSGLVFDEGEVGASNRDAMSKTNKVLREIMSMGRVEQKYVIVNTPSKNFIDKDILRLCDVWITMIRRGLGLVHLLQNEPYSNSLLNPQVQWLEFEDIPKRTPLRAVYNELTREKRKRIQGEDGGAFIPYDEHEKKVDKVRRATKKETRDEVIRGVLNHPEIQQTAVSQRMVGEAVGIDQSTVSAILRGGGSSA